jgi:hypothetical protein
VTGAGERSCYTASTTLYACKASVAGSCSAYCQAPRTVPALRQHRDYSEGNTPQENRGRPALALCVVQARVHANAGRVARQDVSASHRSRRDHALRSRLFTARNRRKDSSPTRLPRRPIDDRYLARGASIAHDLRALARERPPALSADPNDPRDQALPPIDLQIRIPPSEAGDAAQQQGTCALRGRGE